MTLRVDDYWQKCVWLNEERFWYRLITLTKSSRLIQDISRWVYRDAVHPYFVMKVRACRLTGRPDFGNYIAPLHPPTGAYQNFTQVIVARNDSKSMGDHNHIPIREILARGRDNSASGGT